MGSRSEGWLVDIAFDLAITIRCTVSRLTVNERFHPGNPNDKCYPPPTSPSKLNLGLNRPLKALSRGEEKKD